MGLMVVANDKNMKFKCTEYKNGEPYEWQRCIKNPFNGYFIHHMVLTSVKNDILLKKEFADILEKYKDISLLDCKCKKLNWLKSFKETKYTIACVEPENYNFYKKHNFEFEKWEDKTYYFFIMTKKNF